MQSLRTHTAAIAFYALAFPFSTHAAPDNFAELVGEFLSVIEILIPFVIGLTIVVFIWNIVQSFIINNDDTGSIEKGKQLAVWGIIILVIMFSVWGILRLLRDTFFF